MIASHSNRFNNESQKVKMPKPLIWLPKVQEDIYEVIESIINNIMSKDPLLFLTYPDLGLLEYNAAQQRCVLYVENVKILFTYYYSNFYENRFFVIESTTTIDTLSSYDIIKISLHDKILHDDIRGTDPCEKDIPQYKVLEILYKLKLIGVKQ